MPGKIGEVQFARERDRVFIQAFEKAAMVEDSSQSILCVLGEVPCIKVSYLGPDGFETFEDGRKGSDDVFVHWSSFREEIIKEVRGLTTLLLTKRPDSI